MDSPQRYLTDDLVNHYGTGGLSRREFLRRFAIITGGAALAVACGTSATPVPPTATPTPTQTPAPPPTATTAPTAMPAMEPGMTVSPDDPRIEAGPVEIQTEEGTLFAYLSRPATPGPHPGVVVIHENRGLLPHFPDITRRLALEGYAALAVDLLSRAGGTGSFADTDQMRSALGELPRDSLVVDANAGFRYLQNLPYVQGDRVGAMGFCFGGGIVWAMTVSNPELRAAVPFYGSAPPLEEAPNIQSAILGVYAEDDERINSQAPALAEALKQHGKDFRSMTYPGTRHAFFNDTGERYHAEAASQAWEDLLAFFEEHLKG